MMLEQVRNEIRAKRYSICTEQNVEEIEKATHRFRRRKNIGEKRIFQYNSNDVSKKEG